MDAAQCSGHGDDEVEIVYSDELGSLELSEGAKPLDML
jgi:hypothetical protein